MDDNPKINMVISYITKHYPNGTDAGRLASNKLVATAALSPEYSNTQVEDIIDKVAIFNHMKREA
jgi:hypothetical protein